MMWMLWACAGTPATIVTMTGVLGDAPKSAGAPVAGATVDVLDEAYAPFATATTADDGSFQVDVPAGYGFYVLASGEGFLSTAFSGRAGIEDFPAADGLPWIAPEAFADAVRTEFSACTTAAAEGSIVTGEARQYLGDVADLNQLPLASSATVTVTGSDGTALQTCYLDDAGVSTADGAVTGTTGRFAVFGAPEGPMVVETRWILDNSDDPACLFQYAVPADGVVPMYPALVPTEGC